MASIDFVDFTDRPELGWLCMVSASEDSREKCAAKVLELVNLASLPLEAFMLQDGSFWGQKLEGGEAWYARLCYRVVSPILPGPTTIQPHRMKDQSQAGWEASQRDVAAAVSGLLDCAVQRQGDRHVSNAIAAMRTGAPYIGGDRH